VRGSRLAGQEPFRESRATATCVATPNGSALSFTSIRLEWLGGAAPSRGRVPRRGSLVVVLLLASVGMASAECA
jgi:hypothetical protein